MAMLLALAAVAAVPTPGDGALVVALGSDPIDVERVRHREAQFRAEGVPTLSKGAPVIEAVVVGLVIGD